jgi:hypothetical protein
MKTYFFIYADEQGYELWTNAYQCENDEQATELAKKLFMNCGYGDCDHIYFVCVS